MLRSLPVFLDSPLNPYHKPSLTKVGRSGSVLATCNTRALTCYITFILQFPLLEEFLVMSFLFLWIASLFSNFIFLLAILLFIHFSL